MGRIAAVFKADGAETSDRYSISEWWLEPDTQGPGARSHPEDDVFYVVEGTMSLNGLQRRRENVGMSSTDTRRAARPSLALPLEMFAGLVFKDGADREWLKRRFAVYKDIIEESWVYQETKQLGRDEERQETLRRQRQKILGIVQKRFPEMLDLAQKLVNNLKDPDILEDLLLKVGLAQSVQEVLSVLSEVRWQERK